MLAMHVMGLVSFNHIFEQNCNISAASPTKCSGDKLHWHTNNIDTVKDVACLSEHGIHTSVNVDLKERQRQADAAYWALALYVMVRIVSKRGRHRVDVRVCAGRLTTIA